MLVAAIVIWLVPYVLGAAGAMIGGSAS